MSNEKFTTLWNSLMSGKKHRFTMPDGAIDGVCVSYDGSISYTDIGPLFIEVSVEDKPVFLAVNKIIAIEPLGD